jgi:AcrR family transcriptional regulator
MKEPSTTRPVRERVMETACDLFYRQGYHATGINQLIAESGVAKASFYDHFASKDDLLLAYLQEMSRRDIEELRAYCERYDTARERFYAPFELVRAWFPESGYRGCPFQNAAAEVPTGDARLHRAVRSHRERIRKVLRELTRAYAPEEPALAGRDLEELADTYLVLFEGALALGTAYRSVWPVDHAEAALRTMVNAGR